MNDMVSIRMLIECFEDHEAFKAIRHRDSLAHDVIFNEMFVADDENVEYEQ